MDDFINLEKNIHLRFTIRTVLVLFASLSGKQLTKGEK